tara:strand:+ start:1975 stop:2427 length:453 start_codon:yes stop_codon:yes gene_type:complete
MESLTNELKQHSELDDKIKVLNNQVHILRKQRTTLEEKLVSKIKHMKLDYKKLKFSNNAYIVSTTKEKPTLTIDIVKQVASKFIGEDNASELITKINEYRELNKKHQSTLKRRLISNKKSMRKNSIKYAKNPKTYVKNNHTQSLKKKVTN